MAKRKNSPENRDGLGEASDRISAHRQELERIRAADPTDLSIADRLTRTIYDHTFTVEWPSDEGSIKIPLRPATAAELDRLTELRVKLLAAGGSQTTTEYETLFNEFRDIVASLCMDASMNREWFLRGEIPLYYLFQIIEEVMFEEARRIARVQPFRFHKSQATTVEALKPDVKEAV